jgi:hypothetical protein
LEKLRAKLPDVRLDCRLPGWLADREEYERTVDEEIGTYEAIHRLVQGMSATRTEANARYLLRLVERHARLLAFDSHIISLVELESRLREMGAENVALATGGANLGARLAFAERFALQSQEAGLIGLCSDALAEGLNLQGASAVVHLDLPSVVRVLEQRIGRVDRMDSPHEAIEVHWPEEPPEFALRSDERLFLRLRTVDELIGSNVPLPEELAAYRTDRDEAVGLAEVIDAVEASLSGREDAGLPDAFAGVRSLVAGREALVPADTYERLRHSTARIVSCVSVVSSPNPWVFLAIGSTDRGVPRWLLVDLEHGGDPVILNDLDDVTEALRDRLLPNAVELDLDERAASQLSSALAAASGLQRRLLPRRKRRALEEMHEVIGRYLRDVGADEARHRVLTRLDELAGDPAGDLDLGRLADWWLGVMRPRWLHHLTRPNIRRPARLRDLRKQLQAEPIATAELATIERVELDQAPLERRVVAAIVGVVG